jgi:hypothetical protein
MSRRTGSFKSTFQHTVLELRLNDTNPKSSVSIKLLKRNLPSSVIQLRGVCIWTNISEEIFLPPFSV